MATLHQYLLVSGLLFSLGLAGVVLRRNIIIVFMCLELMLSAANLTLIAFSRFHTAGNGLPDPSGQMLVFFVITVAAAEAAVGLAIVISLFRHRKSLNPESFASLKW